MGLRFLDTAAQDLKNFVSIHPDKVGIYYCGATVQGSPHIGHLRSAIVYDQLARWLRYLGYEVTVVRNITDIDDKILANSIAENQTWWSLAYRFECEYTDIYKTLNVLPVTYEPRATGHMGEMVSLIAKLLDSGYAYISNKANGDVYFDVSAWKDYGSFTRQSLDKLVSESDIVDSFGKRGVHDFALWKGKKSTDPDSASWDSPWGRGRPGWHLECSAMSMKYLGNNFDIHGGGVDLRFPHHENEIAQSKAVGSRFANYWLHNGLVMAGGQKMSKSLGNGVFAQDLFNLADPLTVRYYLGSAQYRSVLDYSPESLLESGRAVSRISKFLERYIDSVDNVNDLTEKSVPAAFVAAMNDDLCVPAALAVLHDEVRLGNFALDGLDIVQAGKHFVAVGSMSDILGINPLDPCWSSGSAQDDPSVEILGALIEWHLELRDRAKRDKDFILADSIRDRLSVMGVEVSDSAKGVTWKFV